MVDLEKVAVIEKFELEPHDITGKKLVETEKAVVKMYLLNLPQSFLEKAGETIEKLIEYGHVSSVESGIGFAIISEGNNEVLYNINMWGLSYPHLFFQNLINEVPSEQDSFNKIETDLHGAFCVHEVRIVKYESESWRGYLKSEHSVEDKKKYLDDWAPDDILK